MDLVLVAVVVDRGIVFVRAAGRGGRVGARFVAWLRSLDVVDDVVDDSGTARCDKEL